ncbi:MAG: hypothetical protein Kow0040_17350 [Thermogutta sp.]
MPLNELERLFDSVGMAAERAVAAKRILSAKETDPDKVIIGGPVAQSELVKAVADIKAQIGNAGPPPLRTASAGGEAERPDGGRLAAVVEKLAKVLEHRERTERTADRETASWWSRIGEFIRKQEEAGRAVTGFTRALGFASAFLRGMATGQVLTRSGRSLPWRRALAIRLRGRPRLRPIRSLLQFPDRILRPFAREMRAMQKGDFIRAAGAARSHLAHNSASRASSAAQAASAAARAGTAAKTAAAAVAAGGAGGGSAVAATAAGGAAAGAAGLAAASGVGVAVGAVLVFVAALVIAVAAMRKFTTSVKDAAQASLMRQFSQYAPYSASFSLAEAKMEAYQVRHAVGMGRNTGWSALLLTDALIKLRAEMGPINRAAANLGNVFLYTLVQLARGVNSVLMIARPLLSVLDRIAAYLPKAPEMNVPIEEFLKDLEFRRADPRNPPPRGGFPPWQ